MGVGVGVGVAAVGVRILWSGYILEAQVLSAVTWGPSGSEVMGSQSLFTDNLVSVFCLRVYRHPRSSAMQ